MKRPIIIEFSGLPNSGKTTLTHNLVELCNAKQVKVSAIQEPAELLPKGIPKGTIEQNLWITLETLEKCLELRYVTGVDFILLDRGYYNQLFWATMYSQKDKEYSKYITNFMQTFDEKYRVRPDFLYVVDVSVEESIRRRMAMNKGEAVTFSKTDFLVNYKKSFEEFVVKINEKYYIDTTDLNEKEVSEMVFNELLCLQ